MKDYSKMIFSEIKKNKGALLSLFIILFLCIIALFAPLFAPYDPTKIFDNALRLPPRFVEGGHVEYLLGTDDLGRDLLSRLIFGSRISLMVGLSVVFLSASVGTILGTLAGFYGGIIDRIIMRITDLIMALPSILFAIVIVAVVGPGITNAIIAVSVVSVPNFIRIVRASVLGEKNKQYIMAAKLFGASDSRIMFVEILPNCMAPLIVQATLGFSDGILNCAALGFLGLGAQAPMPEWGVMLSDARSFIESSPWMVTLPGLMIFIVVIAFNLLGDGLRDALDPRLKKQS